MHLEDQRQQLNEQSSNESLQLRHRSLFGQQRTSTTNCAFKDSLQRQIAELSPQGKKTVFLQNLGSNSYASLHSQESYFKTSASLAALKSLQGPDFKSLTSPKNQISNETKILHQSLGAPSYNLIQDSNAVLIGIVENQSTDLNN